MKIKQTCLVVASLLTVSMTPVIHQVPTTNVVISAKKTLPWRGNPRRREGGATKIFTGIMFAYNDIQAP